MSGLIIRGTIVAFFGLLSFVIQATCLAASDESKSDRQISGSDGAAADDKTAWLDDYLATQLQFDEQQIRQFKSNVADMPQVDMRRMLEHIKWSRQFRNEQRELARASQTENYARLQSANSIARAYAARPSSHQVINQRIRTLRRNPRGQSLFGGYYVGLGVGFIGR